MEKSLMFALMLLFLVGTVSACSCMAPGDPKSELDKSIVVFQGSVIAISQEDYNKLVSFEVSKSWKGNTSDKLNLTTPIDSAGCGFDFVEGEEYLVYATGDESDLQVTLCSRTSLLSEAKEDLNLLNNSPGSCKNLYWIDNENKSCGQKRFCDLYMYYGLRTFETKGECEREVNSDEKNYCTGKRPEMCTMQYDPVCGDDGITYGNACGACANENVTYWIAGECKVESEEGKYFNLSNGEKIEIKIMPEVASEKAIERLGELNFTIELKEFTKCNSIFSSCFGSQVVYELNAEKEGKIFGLFRTTGGVKALVNAETGEVLDIKKPWWAFLASGI